MKRAFPHKIKSAAASKLQNEVLQEISKQGQSNSTMACCPAAMIGLAAISTMGVPSILLAGGGDRAIAAEPRAIDVSTEEAIGTVASEQVDVASGAKTPKGLLLQKLTREYVEEASEAENPKTLETVLLVGQKQENPSFHSIIKQEPQKKVTRATMPYQQQALVSNFSGIGANKPSELKTQVRPQNSQLEVSEAIGSNKQLKTETDLKAEPKNRTATNLVGSSSISGWEKTMAQQRYEESESSSNSFSLGTISGKSSEKTFLEQSSGPEENESIIEVGNPRTEIVLPVMPVGVKVEAEPERINTPTEAIAELSKMTTKVEGAVVIESDRIEAPVSTVYEVRSGDTLAVIARSHGVSVEELVALNNLRDPNWLKVSQTLKIPQKRSRPFGEETRDSASTASTYDSTKVDSNPIALSPNESTDYGFTLPTTQLPRITDATSSIPAKGYVGEVPTVEGFQLVSLPKQAGEYLAIHTQQKEKFADRVPPLTLKVDSAITASPLSPDVADANGIESVSVIGPEDIGKNSPRNLTQTSTQTETVERERGYNQDYSEISQQNSGNNSYSQRLRTDILRLRQQYEFEKESQPTTNNWDSEASGDNNSDEWEPSLNNSPTPTDRDTITPEVNSNGWSQFRKPEINSPNNRGVFERMSPRRQEINRPERFRRQEQRPAEEPRMVGATSDKAQEILNSSLGEMVSPDLPPLEGADTYLPGGSIQFTGYMWPTKGTLTSGYGWRWGRMHQGIDIAAPTGTPIMAAAPGVVSFAGWNSGYGYLVEIKHPDESLTLYAHNSQILVQEGQAVTQGELIAKMGSTGRSTGPHLHFEIHPMGNGAANPIAYLPSTQASR